MSNSFYQKILMDHFKNPRNKKEIKKPSFSSGEDNPSCGDKVLMTGVIDGKIITDIAFEGTGCVISMALASMLTEKCMGKTVKEALELTKSDILEMIGLELGPNRLKCALLPLEALHKGILKYLDEE